MAQRPATALEPAKIDLLRKALTVAPMTLDLTGLSMYPAIRFGDRCRVMAVEPDSIQIGDVILATREDRLFAHRVIAIKPGPPIQWTIKGDTLLWPDPPVASEDILGQVVGLERKGRFVDLRAPKARTLGRAQAALSRPYSKLFVRALLARRRTLSKLASLPLWRARRHLPDGAITVHAATDADVGGIAMLFAEQHALRNAMGAVDMDLVRHQARQMLKGTQSVSAVLWVAEVDGFVAGHAVTGPLNEDNLDLSGSWVMSVYVKMTSRGRGVAEAMLRAGIEDAIEKAEPSIRYAAFATNRASLALAEKLGFSPDDSEPARLFAAHYNRMDPSGPPLHVLVKELP